MNADPIVQRAYDAAVSILEEAGYVNGVVLICEVERSGLMVAVDDDRTPLGPLSDLLRRTADRIDVGAYD